MVGSLEIDEGDRYVLWLQLNTKPSRITIPVRTNALRSPLSIQKGDWLEVDSVAVDGMGKYMLSLQYKTSVPALLHVEGLGPTGEEAQYCLVQFPPKEEPRFVDRAVQTDE